MKLSGMKCNPIIYLVLSIFGTVAVTLMLEKPAKASLEICNETGQEVHTGRVTYKRNGKSVLEGAVKVLNSGKCMVAIRGNLTDRSDDDLYNIPIRFPNPPGGKGLLRIILRNIDVGNDSDFTYTIGQEPEPKILPRDCPAKAGCLFY